MENAIYEGKMIVAYDVSKDYNFEEQVRSASGRRELRCPDPECKNPTVKYCHGDKKDAYFAHIDNDSCNYAKYDRSNDEDIRRIQRKLYCHFKDKFNVCMDYKGSSNCYAHLLIEIDDFNKIGVRIVKETKSPTESEIKRTTEDFNNKCIILRWIVIGDTSCEVIEDKVCWIKRELLNKDNNL
ncbi:MAG: hypothetical protein SOU50_05820, partial [Oscillospiraceae bacterium]|nr:hypothetical protein [Oscillospiraceae bacterium]